METHERVAILLRHGIAHERSTKAEEERDLTSLGHKRMKETARGLAMLFPKACALLSSPLLRCRQTAEWVQKAYGGKLSTVTRDALRPEGDRAALRALIESVDARRIIIVGHEPYLTEAMLLLTGMNAEHDIELKKGGCYRIRLGADGARLDWMLSPRVLRQLRP